MIIGATEEWTVFTPLGLRFWDVALGRSVTQGLRVRCWPRNNEHQKVDAYRTRSDVYSFRWLPGLRSLEHGFDDARAPTSPPGQRNFVVVVSDRRNRYLDVALDLSLPLGYRGIYQFPAIPALGGVPLFSAPPRAMEPRLALVRGTLADAETGRPAGWGRLRLGLPGGQGYHGVADAGGRFVVAFPYPPVLDGFARSPGGPGNSAAITERGWEMLLTVFYRPDVLSSAPGSSTPELGSVLRQGQGTIWRTAPDPSDVATDSLPVRLHYGEDLVLRSEGAHQLFINQAVGSP